MYPCTLHTWAVKRQSSYPTFVEKSLEILNDGGKASQLSDLQYDTLLKVNNVESSAPKMEQIWKTIAQGNN
jgi:hypothetical protein